jgi:hypothetical protein
MPRSRALKGVIAGFLGTFASRNSDYDGYWLFGLLVEAPQEVKIDLLQSSASPPGSEPWAFATRLARLKFQKLLAQAGLSPQRLEAATLEIGFVASDLTVSGHNPGGYFVDLAVSVSGPTGCAFSGETRIFAFPHLFGTDRRSTRRFPEESQMPGWTGT